MKKQEPTPASLRRGLPRDPGLRRPIYLKRYGVWWRKKHSTYMRDYGRRYRADGREG